MATIVLFSGLFCREDEVIEEILATTDLKVIDDEAVVAEAAGLAGVAASKISQAFSPKLSVFNKFTMEKERAIAYLKLALSNMLSDESLLLQGHTGLLIPKQVSHVLKVCLIAEMPYRIQSAVIDKQIAEKEALKMIRNSDGDSATWTRTLFQMRDPWDQSLYDMVIPMDKRKPSDAATAIIQNAAKSAIQPSQASRQAFNDFKLAAQVETTLFTEGHHVVVKADQGTVTLIINRHALMLKRLEEELKSIAQKIPGVVSVTTEVGRDFHKSQIYRKHDFESPAKVLLVDDEREFIETLSDRLMIRDVSTAVAHDGQSALAVLENDDPEVMIIDLRIPDISGLEILKQVKKTRPAIEVIVLTGHGSDEDKDLCLNLGAFAYLQKPVEIDMLNEVIQKASATARSKKGS